MTCEYQETTTATTSTKEAINGNNIKAGAKVLYYRHTNNGTRDKDTVSVSTDTTASRAALIDKKDSLHNNTVS